MSEARAIEIAESADLVLNGYAVTRDGENFKVVNLRTGKAAYIMSSGVPRHQLAPLPAAQRTRPGVHSLTPPQRASTDPGHRESVRSLSPPAPALRVLEKMSHPRRAIKHRLVCLFVFLVRECNKHTQERGR